MGVKRKKTGRGTVDDFDATPPGDGDISDRGNRPEIPPSFKVGQGKGLKKYIDAYRLFLINSFRSMPREQQIVTINRFAQILCIGISVVILQLFYSVLIPQVRIISLPLIVGAAWFVANKLVAPALIKRLEKYINRD